MTNNLRRENLYDRKIRRLKEKGFYPYSAKGRYRHFSGSEKRYNPSYVHSMGASSIAREADQILEQYENGGFREDDGNVLTKERFWLMVGGSVKNKKVLRKLSDNGYGTYWNLPSGPLYLPDDLFDKYILDAYDSKTGGQR